MAARLVRWWDVLDSVWLEIRGVIHMYVIVHVHVASARDIATGRGQGRRIL